MEIITKSIEELKNSHHKFKDNDIATIEDKPSERYIYKNGNWELIPTTSTINTGMKVYEMNKNIISQMKPANKEKMQEIKAELVEFEESCRGNKYFMLLCKDYNYYTIFHKAGTFVYKNFVISVLDILTELGDLIIASITTDKTAVEIWIKIKGEAYCFYLFPYDKGVVECI